MRIALFSPLNPVKSGISDYTEELLPELARDLELDLYIDKGYRPSAPGLAERFRVLPFEPERFQPHTYDAILYHMGNYYDAHGYVYESLKRFPGIVVLHDFVMQSFYAEQYEAEGDFSRYRGLLEKYYGEQGREIAERIQARSPMPIWESPDAARFPLNEEILAHARGVIVHSRFIHDRIRHMTEVPIAVIPHHGHVLKQFDVAAIRRDLGIQEGDILICSAGYVSKNKRFDLILDALGELKGIPFRFVIAGEDRGRLLTPAPPGNRIDFRITGHLPLDKMEATIAASDICINLRYPTMGESSGVQIRMMGYGKPVLVTNLGSYAEFPDYAVLKVDVNLDETELIKRFTLALATDEDFRMSVGREAGAYVEQECSISRCAELYMRFIRECVKGD
ncbi:MAG: glycosyltransferase family 4 protein [Candidatus Aminicenantaceae bacterium]